MDDTQHDRDAARRRLSILEAFCAVIERRQEFMDVVSVAPSADEARVAIQEMFDLDATEATATLDLQVRRFAGEERERIVAERDEMRRTVHGEDDPAARMRDSLERTAQVAADFVGLTEAEARTKAQGHPEVQFEFVPWDGAASLDLRSNRVRLWMRDGSVESASAG